MARPLYLSLVLAVGICLPQLGLAFNIYKVGVDAHCPYSNIQAAIDAAATSLGEDYVWIAMNQDYSGQQVHVADQDVDIEGGFTDSTTTTSHCADDGQRFRQ